jgi:acyl carrier protein
MNDLLDLIREELDVVGEVDPHTPLVSSGLVDSFGLPSLVCALEEHYGVRIDADEIGADNFDTPAQMLALVEARL